ncbi:hypothetical protein BOTBODRAFT_179215 [Botryobasidium botryosum FD-172 SS1]|uniref:Uncharacterized protein n=1 Tax=Botryobasidium botryosum (strain FD-172 SS1) TaxID=930990 RepID=A0A067M3A7_BOTB1|nr:hypothetical protein BOTBODRAFT_179215 [Botryobasidium botryosum FD-172 SS1]
MFSTFVFAGAHAAKQAWAVAVAIGRAAFQMLHLSSKLLFALIMPISNPTYIPIPGLPPQPRVELQYISPFEEEEEQAASWDVEARTEEVHNTLFDERDALVKPSVKVFEAEVSSYVKPDTLILSTDSPAIDISKNIAHPRVESVDVHSEIKHAQVSPVSWPIRKAPQDSQVEEVVGEGREDEGILVLDFAARVQVNKKPLSRYQQDTLASARKRRSKYMPSSPPATPGPSPTRTSRLAKATPTPACPALPTSASPAMPRVPLASRTNMPSTPARASRPAKKNVAAQLRVPKGSVVVNELSSPASPVPEPVTVSAAVPVAAPVAVPVLVVVALPAPAAPRVHDMAIIMKRIVNVSAQKIYRVIHADSDEELVNEKSIMNEYMISFIKSTQLNSPRMVINMLESAPKHARRRFYDELMMMDVEDSETSRVAGEESEEGGGRKREAGVSKSKVAEAVEQWESRYNDFYAGVEGRDANSSLRKNFRL